MDAKEETYSRPRDDKRRIKILIKKQKKLIGSHKKITGFKEPVVFFIRNNGHVEFYENAKNSKFRFQTEKEQERTIELDTGRMLTFDYGNNNFKGYILHEDNPFPLPIKPVIDAELLYIITEKVLNDMRKWKAEELKALSGIIGKIALFAMVIIGGYILYKIMVKEPPTPADQGIIQIVQNGTQLIIRNATG